MVPRSSTILWTAASSASRRAAVSYSHWAGIGTAGELGEHRAQGAGGLAFRGQQTAQIAAQLFGQGEDGEGLAQWRQVDDEKLVAVVRPVALGGAAKGVQQGELTAAGKFGQLLGVEPVATEQVEHRGRLVLEGEEFGAEVLSGVDAGEPESFGDLGGFRGVGEAGYGVGGEQQRATAPAGGGQCGRRRHGGTAGAAGAGDEDRTHRVSPAGRTRRASSGLPVRGR